MVSVVQTSSRILRQAMPAAVLGVCLVFLWPMVKGLDAAQLWLSWQSIAGTDWILAGVFTLVSFLAIGQYDVIAHRQLDTGLPAEQARISGMTAIALSQTVGFGLVTATLARWRMLRGFGPGVAALVTGFVSLNFLASMTALTALACIFLPSPQYLLPFSSCVLLGLLCLLVLAIRYPRMTLRGHAVEFPGLRAVSASTGWAALDMVAACMVLWLLIPEAARPDYLSFFPVFCLAICAGLFSGTPSGAGPFELVLLALCAHGLPAETDTSALMAAVVAFRLVYFALPACAAVVMLLARPVREDVWRDPEPPCLYHAPRAESSVIRQNGGAVERIGATYAAVWPTGQAFVAMYDPFDTPQPGFFPCLADRARDRNRFALIYKAHARTALAARKAGWACIHGADDAVIDLHRFTLQTPERSGLRRKLRKAAKAGVRIRPMGNRDLPAMAEIDAGWQAHQGAARGGSMGRFCPGYLTGQRVLVAERDGQLIAFVTLQQGAREWALDLMRHVPSVPDGTMHALVHAGIEAAAKAGVAQFSLAAVPACPDPKSALWRMFAFRVAGLSRSAGLRQFKSSFAPRWQPLYLAAPSPLALVIASLDVAREVFLPVRLPDRSRTRDFGLLSGAHKEDEINEVASKVAA